MSMVRIVPRGSLMGNDSPRITTDPIGTDTASTHVRVAISGLERPVGQLVARNELAFHTLLGHNGEADHAPGGAISCHRMAKCCQDTKDFLAAKTPQREKGRSMPAGGTGEGQIEPLVTNSSLCSLLMPGLK